jgi:hypothetical protein
VDAETAGAGAVPLLFGSTVHAARSRAMTATRIPSRIDLDGGTLKKVYKTQLEYC